MNRCLPSGISSDESHEYWKEIAVTTGRISVDVYTM
jgi:hypothetical protein